MVTFAVDPWLLSQLRSSQKLRKEKVARAASGVENE